MAVTKSKNLVVSGNSELSTTVGRGKFDGAAARFLATKTDKTRASYKHSLGMYRDLAAEYGFDPLSKDCVIAFNAVTHKAFDAGEITADTVRTRLKALSSFWGWAYRNDRTRIKPELVRKDLLKIPPAKPLSPRDILTVAEVRDLLDTAADDRTYLFLRLMLDAGLRVSELLGLKCGDVYSADDRYFVLVTKGKGAKARDVEVSEDLYQLVVDYTSSLGLDLLKDKEPIFQLHRSSIWRIVSETAKVAGIDKQVSPHSLRHTHGNQLAQMDWRIEEIGHRLGHSNYDVTRRYTRPAELLAKRKISSMPWVEI